MGRKFTQSEIEEELKDLVLNIETKKELAFATYYIGSREREGYNVKRFKDFVESIKVFSEVKLSLNNYLLN